jgi:hypothetical protein
MATVKFLNPNTTLHVPGFGKVDSDNLTYEKYEKLLAISEQHAVFFQVTEDEKPVVEKKVKSKQNSNESELQA